MVTNSLGTSEKLWMCSRCPQFIFSLSFIRFVLSSNSQWDHIMFSICSPCFCYVPQHIPNNTFFYPLCFGKCCPLLTYIDGSKGRNTTLFYFGDYCMCTILLIVKFLFHITPTSKWNGNFLLRDSPNFGLS